jgi:hypothetical protein
MRRGVVWLSVLGAAALVIAGLRLLEYFLPATYAVIKDWQTLVAGLVGFGGLAWVTYENAKLERERDARIHQQSVAKEQAALEERAKAFAAVVSWEIAFSLLEVVTAKKRLRNLLDSGEPKNTGEAKQILETLRDIPSPHFLDPSSLSSISLLPGELVGKVCGFYYELHDVQGLWRFQAYSREEIRKFESRLRIPLERGNAALVVASSFVEGAHEMATPVEVD